MSDSTQDVRNDIRATRQRMDETIGEIENRISETAESVRRRVDVISHARNNPWAALGLALGAGFAIGLTGADRKAAKAAVSGAAAAGTAIARNVVSAKDAVAGLAHHGTDESARAPSVATAADAGQRWGLGEQIDGAIEGLLFEGLTEVMASLGRGTPQTHTRRTEGTRKSPEAS